MLDDEDWVMRPAVAGLCGYESLVNGALDLEDVDRMNEALDVFEENRQRLKPKDDD